MNLTEINEIYLTGQKNPAPKLKEKEENTLKKIMMDHKNQKYLKDKLQETRQHSKPGHD